MIPDTKRPRQFMSLNRSHQLNVSSLAFCSLMRTCIVTGLSDLAIKGIAPFSCNALYPCHNPAGFVEFFTSKQFVLVARMWGFRTISAWPTSLEKLTDESSGKTHGNISTSLNHKSRP